MISFIVLLTISQYSNIWICIYLKESTSDWEVDILEINMNISISFDSSKKIDSSGYRESYLC